MKSVFEHQHVCDQQRQQYNQELEDLRQGTSPYTEILHMDFSQLQLDNCVFLQDMIVVVKYPDPNNPGKLVHFYRHYVAETTSINNDTGFMKECLRRAITGTSILT